MSEPNWGRTPWNAPPGELAGDRFDDDYEEDDEEDCCDHGVPFSEDCEECEAEEDLNDL